MEVHHVDSVRYEFKDHKTQLAKVNNLMVGRLIHNFLEFSFPEPQQQRHTIYDMRRIGYFQEKYYEKFGSF